MNSLHKIPASQLIAALADHPDLQYPSPAAVVARVLELTSTIFHVPVPDLLGRSHIPRIANPRSIAMAATYELGLTQDEIGFQFGNRDHSSIYHARKRAPELCDLNPQFAESTRHLRAALALSPNPPSLISQSSVTPPVLGA